MERDYIRESKIIQMYMARISLREIGKVYDISGERVRQIINRARKEGKLNGHRKPEND